MNIYRALHIAYRQLEEAVAADPRCQTIEDAYRRSASDNTKKALENYLSLRAEKDREEEGY